MNDQQAERASWVGGPDTENLDASKESGKQETPLDKDSTQFKDVCIIHKSINAELNDCKSSDFSDAKTNQKINP